MTLTRRDLVAGSLGLGLAAFAGCGGSGDRGGSSAGGASSGATSIDHKYGTAELPGTPERVVTVGFNEHDFALALGIVPVAVREWYGDRPQATWSWAQDELGSATPEVLPEAELNFEQIAALRPDLILGIYSGMTERDHGTLAEIAPTVAQSGEFQDFGMPWQEQLQVTGVALGRADRARRLVDAVEGRFARAREGHPEFDGMTAATAYAAEGSFGLYSSQDPRARFMASLGFETPAAIDELTGDGVAAELSDERFRLLDQDVVVLYEGTGIDRAEVERDPLYRRLNAVREGRVIYLGEFAPLSGALSFSSPLSLGYALDEMVPRLAAL